MAGIEVVYNGQQEFASFSLTGLVATDVAAFSVAINVRTMHSSLRVLTTM